MCTFQFARAMLMYLLQSWISSSGEIKSQRHGSFEIRFLTWIRHLTQLSSVLSRVSWHLLKIRTFHEKIFFHSLLNYKILETLYEGFMFVFVVTFLLKNSTKTNLEIWYSLVNKIEIRLIFVIFIIQSRFNWKIQIKLILRHRLNFVFLLIFSKRFVCIYNNF